MTLLAKVDLKIWSILPSRVVVFLVHFCYSRCKKKPQRWLAPPQGTAHREDQKLWTLQSLAYGDSKPIPTHTRAGMVSSTSPILSLMGPRGDEVERLEIVPCRRCAEALPRPKR